MLPALIISGLVGAIGGSPLANWTKGETLGHIFGYSLLLMGGLGFSKASKMKGQVTVRHGKNPPDPPGRIAAFRARRARILSLTISLGVPVRKKGLLC